MGSYISTEAPDYIARGSMHGDYKNRKTIFCNAEEIDREVEHNSIDTIFSVACFEHIYDLPEALESCFKCSKRGGSLYSFFAPIYSHIALGDHGVIPKHENFPEKPIGFHLLNQRDQRKRLIEAGFTDNEEIQEFLGCVNFKRKPNRLYCEDYERICTESKYAVLELVRHEAYNCSKKYAQQFGEVRKSNQNVKNMMTSGFKIHLIKT